MYGIIVTLGILVSLLTAEHFVKAERKDTEIYWGSVLVGIVFGVLGARLYHIIYLWEYYSVDFLRIFMINHGGMGIIGALIVGGIAVTYYLKKKNQNVLEWLDIGALVFPLGHGIGRWGNYVNGELLPYAIYESILNLMLFLALFVTFTFEKKRPDGLIFVLYVIGYSIIRIGLESTKAAVWSVGGINIAQLICFVATILSAGFLLKLKTRA